MRVAVVALVLAGSLLAAGCGRPRSASQAPGSQTLRMCVDRWNQGNMRGWGPTVARVRGWRAGVRTHCVVGLAVAYKGHIYGGKNAETYACVLYRSGAYACPHTADGGPELGEANARVNGRGVLTLDRPLAGTHPTPRLAWQRYPHIDGVVEPWTARGTLRKGLRFSGSGSGPCFVVAETLVSAVSCLAHNGRYEACFPQSRHWHVGDIAACDVGSTTFVRWKETPDSGQIWIVSAAGLIGDLRIDHSTAPDIARAIGSPELTGRGTAPLMGRSYRYAAYGCSRAGHGLDPGGGRPVHRRCETVFFLDGRTGRLDGFWTDSKQFQTTRYIQPGMRQRAADRLVHTHAHVGALTGIEIRKGPVTLFIQNGGCSTHGGNPDTTPCLGGHVTALILDSRRHPSGLLEDAIRGA